MKNTTAPRGYGLGEVEKSLAIMKKYGAKSALNLLAYPGYTDRPPVLEALIKLCQKTGVRQIQLRNLNINPRQMKIFLPEGCGMGLRQMLQLLKDELPEAEIGNYSRPAKVKMPE